MWWERQAVGKTRVRVRVCVCACARKSGENRPVSTLSPQQNMEGEEGEVSSTKVHAERVAAVTGCMCRKERESGRQAVQ